MTIREATVKDIEQLHRVRCSVKENKLSDPGLVTVDHYNEYLTTRGKGWVCEVEDAIGGFAVADLQENNIWALFIKPEFEGKGIGRRLHEQMLQWYFGRGKEKVWLSTTPGTRAAKFYRNMGWTETGLYGDDEIKFELTREEWFKRSIYKSE